MTEQPDLNTGKEWSKKDLFSLRNRIEHGRTVTHIATFLMRTETEVREKVPSLGSRFLPSRLSAAGDYPTRAQLHPAESRDQGGDSKEASGGDGTALIRLSPRCAPCLSDRHFGTSARYRLGE
jgi:hypothetical protein